MYDNCTIYLLDFFFFFLEFLVPFSNIVNYILEVRCIVVLQSPNQRYNPWQDSVQQTQIMSKLQTVKSSCFVYGWFRYI
jgi:hypothetical protein